MGTAVEGDVWIDDDDLTSWYASFKAANPTGIPTTAAAWYLAVQQFVTQNPAGRSLEGDIKFNVDNNGVATGIRTARFRTFYKPLSGSTEQVDAMTSLRATVEGVGFGTENAFPYTREYLDWEQYAVIGTEAAQNLSLALGCVMVVNLVLIGSIAVAALVGLCVVLTVISMLGFAYYWNIDLDAVVVVNAVIAIGLAVDYAAHVGHGFLQMLGSKPERVAKSLTMVAIPVLNGAFSTFLAVLVLAFSQSYVFRVFFIMFFLVVVFGVWHGVFFLPAVLRWIGPGSNVDERSEMDARYYLDAGLPIPGDGDDNKSATSAEDGGDADDTYRVSVASHYSSSNNTTTNTSSDQTGTFQQTTASRTESEENDGGVQLAVSKEVSNYDYSYDYYE